MFGHDTNQQAVMGAPQVQQPTMPPQDMSSPVTPDPMQQQVPAAPMFGAPAAQDMTQASFSMPAPTPDQSAAAPAPVSDPTPAFGMSTAGPVQPPTDVPVTDGAATPAPTAPVDHSQLADMKREALKHLEPLADHLDGTPEETFRATMMMIQANDNHTLLEKAFNAAKQIQDDKERAQALLDFVNELNYFSQSSQE